MVTTFLSLKKKKKGQNIKENIVHQNIEICKEVQQSDIILIMNILLPKF